MVITYGGDGDGVDVAPARVAPARQVGDSLQLQVPPAGVVWCCHCEILLLVHVVYVVVVVLLDPRLLRTA